MRTSVYGMPVKVGQILPTFLDADSHIRNAVDVPYFWRNFDTFLLDAAFHIWKSGTPEINFGETFWYGVTDFRIRTRTLSNRRLACRKFDSERTPSMTAHKLSRLTIRTLPWGLEALVNKREAQNDEGWAASRWRDTGLTRVPLTISSTIFYNEPTSNIWPTFPSWIDNINLAYFTFT